MKERIGDGEWSSGPPFELRTLKLLNENGCQPVEPSTVLASRLVSMGLLGILVGGCLERRAAVPTDISPNPEAAQILLYRPSDATLGSGTAVVSINGTEVANLASAQHKIVTATPGDIEISVAGGPRFGRYVATFVGKKGKVYKFAVRVSGEVSIAIRSGEPQIKVLQNDGTFKIERL